MSTILGGSNNSSTQHSGNQSYNSLTQPLGSILSAGSGAIGSLGSALGQGFQAFKDNSGFNFALNQGQRNIAGGAAAKGILNSGSTGKALAGYESNLGSQTYDNYLGQLGNLGKIGVGGAGVLSDAGKYSDSQSKGSSSGGLLPALALF